MKKIRAKIAASFALAALGSCASESPSVAPQPAPAHQAAPAPKTAPAPTRSTAELSDRLFTLLGAGEYVAAAAMFHEPAPDASSTHRDDVARALTLVVPRVPPLTTWSLSVSRDEVLFGEISAGHRDYWQQFSTLAELVYEARFDETSPLFVRVRFCQFEGRVEVRSISLGLPTYRDDAEAQLTKIFKTPGRPGASLDETTPPLEVGVLQSSSK